MDRLYRPEVVEERWQRTWEEEGLYEAAARRRPRGLRDRGAAAERDRRAPHGPCDERDAAGRPHSLAPDARPQRLWQPGYDHAGIATQNVVERELAKEGSTRHDLGREAFVERVWAWLEEYGGIIMGQYRRLGASRLPPRAIHDGRRLRAGGDALLRHLYERGWIYRDNRIVNWCPRCATAISDLEVVHDDVDDVLAYVRYPLADGSGHVTVATVRPPTILADVAVAVSPDDERYASLVGRR